MNNQKRTINPLLGCQFRYEQPEDVTYKYQVNWGCAQQQTIVDSAWTVINGDAVLSGSSYTVPLTTIDDDDLNYSGASILVTDGVYADSDFPPGQVFILIAGSVGNNTILNTVTFVDGQTDSRIIKLKITDNYSPNVDYDYGI